MFKAKSGKYQGSMKNNYEEKNAKFITKKFTM
jgi:hypothetical protein